MSDLLDDVDRLYEGCVFEPDRWPDQAIEDWVEAVGLNHQIDRTEAKYIRRIVAGAVKLRTFWSEAESGPADWRSRVDIALGQRAWRPQLDLAEYELSRTSSVQAFDRVAALFPVVRNEPYLDGISYEEWLDRQGRRSDQG